MSVKSGRITMGDIAKRLGLSVATVHRALSGGGYVGADTLRAVERTAKEMGYRTNRLAQGLKQKGVKIAVVLRNRCPEFQDLVMAGARRACADLADYNVKGEFFMLGAENACETMRARLLDLSESGVDAVIFCPVGGRRLQDVADRLIGKNIRLAALLSGTELDGVDFSVMPDSKRMGRIASELLAMKGLARGSRIAVFVGQRDFLQHRDYIDAFFWQSERFGFDIVRVVEHHDNEQIAYYAAGQLFEDFPEVEGIYCATAINPPVCKKVKELGLAGRVAIIGTDVLSGHIPYIKDGTLTAAIFQDPYKQGYKAFKNMFEMVAQRRHTEKKFFINPQIVIGANLDYYEQYLRMAEKNDMDGF